jgi:hypothetical protein
VVRPFFEEMGLKPPDPVQFQRILRDSLVEGNPSKASGRPTPNPNAWISTVFARIESAFGSGFLQHLHAWMFSVLFPAEDLPYNAWRLIFSMASRSAERWSSLGFYSEHAEDLRHRYLELSETEVILRSIGEMRAEQLSEWDLAMFALNRFYDEENDPFSEVMNAVKRHRLFTFWDELERSTSPEERERVLKSAQNYANSKGLSVTLAPLRGA